MRLGSVPAHRLAVDLLSRSICAVQVAAVLEDRWGIFSWGWNHSGSDGYGQHAEAHSLSRANRDRLEGSTMWVAARRRKSGNPVCACPCEGCRAILGKVRDVWYRDKSGQWKSWR
jgi:hypothetical protein